MPRSAVDQATNALRSLIARGRYQPGDRLPPERELAGGLGVSRPTVREAIRRLVEGALLEPRRGSGTYVAQIDLDAVFAVRLQLEPYAAHLAATNRSGADLYRLAALVKRLAAELDAPEAYAATDLEIHAVVTEAAGNPVLQDVLSRIIEIGKLSRAMTSPERSARAATLRQMRLLVRAIRSRDSVTAAGAMEDHLNELRAIARARRLECPEYPLQRPSVHTIDEGSRPEHS